MAWFHGDDSDLVMAKKPAPESLPDFRERIRAAMRERTGEIILSASVERNAVITASAFNGAQSTVDILTARLDPTVFADKMVLASTQYFLAHRGHRARILVESNPGWRNPFVRSFAEFMSEPVIGIEDARRLEIRIVPAGKFNYTYNFTLVDKYGQSFQGNRQSSAAITSYLPESETANFRNLREIFNILWASSTPLRPGHGKSGALMESHPA